MAGQQTASPTWSEALETYERTVQAIRAMAGSQAAKLDVNFLWFLATGLHPVAGRLPRQERTRLERVDRDLPALLGSPPLFTELDGVERILTLVRLRLHGDEVLHALERWTGADLRASARKTSLAANLVLAALELEFRRLLHRPARALIVTLLRAVQPAFFENCQDPVEIVRKRAAAVPTSTAQAYLETLRQLYTQPQAPLPLRNALLGLLSPLVIVPPWGHARRHHGRPVRRRGHARRA